MLLNILSSPCLLLKLPFNKFLLPKYNALSSLSKPSYRVLVVGGGTGGLAVLTNLSKKLENAKIGLIEPSSLHYNQPLWTFVGAGLQPFSESVKPLSFMLPKNVEWIQGKAIHIDPKAQLVTANLKNGMETLHYEYLILAPGLELRLDKVNGLEQAFKHHEGISTNYHPDYVRNTEKVMKALAKGHAVFTMPSTPIKCAGAPQKIMYLADSYWRRRGQRDHIEISYFTGVGKLFSVPKYEKELLNQCEKRKLSIHVFHDLIEVDGANQIATFRLLQPLTPNSNPTPSLVSPPSIPSTISVPYDFLHVTPPMAPPSFLVESKLTDTAGFISVDPQTLQHTEYPTIFALGDASCVPTSRTAAAVAVESLVVEKNLIHFMHHQPISNRYNGYTSCPLIINEHEVILAEFSGFDLKPMETSPFDQSKPTRWAYILTSKILPFFYWHGLVQNGWWKGPNALRRIMLKLSKTFKDGPRPLDKDSKH